jgi:anti-anti-sigma factor
MTPLHRPATAHRQVVPPVQVRTDRVALLTVAGEVDDVDLENLRRHIEAEATLEVRGVMLDLSEVTRCDQSLVALVARTHAVLAERDVWLWLTGLSEPVLSVLRDAQLHHVMLITRISRCRLPMA